MSALIVEQSIALVALQQKHFTALSLFFWSNPLPIWLVLLASSSLEGMSIPSAQQSL